MILLPNPKPNNNHRSISTIVERGGCYVWIVDNSKSYFRAVGLGAYAQFGGVRGFRVILKKRVK